MTRLVVHSEELPVDAIDLAQSQAVADALEGRWLVPLNEAFPDALAEFALDPANLRGEIVVVGTASLDSESPLVRLLAPEAALRLTLFPVLPQGRSMDLGVGSVASALPPLLYDAGLERTVLSPAVGALLEAILLAGDDDWGEMKRRLATIGCATWSYVQWFSTGLKEAQSAVLAAYPETFLSTPGEHERLPELPSLPVPAALTPPESPPSPAPPPRDAPEGSPPWDEWVHAKSEAWARQVTEEVRVHLCVPSLASALSAPLAATYGSLDAGLERWILDCEETLIRGELTVRGAARACGEDLGSGTVHDAAAPDPGFLQGVTTRAEALFHEGLQRVAAAHERLIDWEQAEKRHLRTGFLVGLAAGALLIGAASASFSVPIGSLLRWLVPGAAAGSVGGIALALWLHHRGHDRREESRREAHVAAEEVWRAQFFAGVEAGAVEARAAVRRQVEVRHVLAVRQRVGLLKYRLTAADQVLGQCRMKLDDMPFPADPHRQRLAPGATPAPSSSKSLDLHDVWRKGILAGLGARTFLSDLPDRIARVTGTATLLHRTRNPLPLSGDEPGVRDSFSLDLMRSATLSGLPNPDLTEPVVSCLFAAEQGIRIEGTAAGFLVAQSHVLPDTILAVRFFEVPKADGVSPDE